MTLRVAVDFGTSSTCVAISVAGREPQVVAVDGPPLMSSAVYAAADGTLFVGQEADRQAAIDPSRYEPHPKRRIDETELLLGASVLQVRDVVRAVLSRAVGEARRVGRRRAGRPARADPSRGLGRRSARGCCARPATGSPRGSCSCPSRWPPPCSTPRASRRRAARRPARSPCSTSAAAPSTSASCVPAARPAPASRCWPPGATRLRRRRHRPAAARARRLARVRHRRGGLARPRRGPGAGRPPPAAGDPPGRARRQGDAVPPHLHRRADAAAVPGRARHPGRPGAAHRRPARPGRRAHRCPPSARPGSRPPTSPGSSWSAGPAGSRWCPSWCTSAAGSCRPRWTSPRPWWRGARCGRSPAPARAPACWRPAAAGDVTTGGRGRGRSSRCRPRRRCRAAAAHARRVSASPEHGPRALLLVAGGRRARRGRRDRAGHRAAATTSSGRRATRTHTSSDRRGPADRPVRVPVHAAGGTGCRPAATPSQLRTEVKPADGAGRRRPGPGPADPALVRQRRRPGPRGGQAAWPSSRRGRRLLRLRRARVLRGPRRHPLPAGAAEQGRHGRLVRRVPGQHPGQRRLPARERRRGGREVVAAPGDHCAHADHRSVLAS